MGRFIKRVIKILCWIPILWKDHDWDHHYMFKILHYKLSRMEKSIRNGYAANSDKTADEIKTAKLLLDRICNKDYISNAMVGHEERWGKCRMGFGPTNPVTRTSRMLWVYERNLTDAEKARERKEFMMLGRHSEYMEKQDVEYLFKFMSKHYKKWWD